MSVSADICVCTLDRDSLAATLASIAAQELPEGVAIRAIVADNNAAPLRQAEVAELGARLGLAIAYVHAPQRNISVARNACLAAATGDLIAFIDDDEEACPDWIAQLLAARDGCDVVFGVSRALYNDPRIPRWAASGDFHSNRMGPRDAAWNGYTANVLIDRGLLERTGLRFAPELGQTGGEDTMFFLEASLKGARFGYAPDAIVTEDTPAARATLKWLLLRRYRAGQIHNLVLTRLGKRASGVAMAIPKCAASLAAALLMVWSPRRAVANLLRAALHAGVIAAAAKAPLYREYAGGPENR